MEMFDLVIDEFKEIGKYIKDWWKKQTPLGLVKDIVIGVAVSFVAYMGIVLLFSL